MKKFIVKRTVTQQNLYLVEANCKEDAETLVLLHDSGFSDSKLCEAVSLVLKDILRDDWAVAEHDEH